MNAREIICLYCRPETYLHIRVKWLCRKIVTNKYGIIPEFCLCCFALCVHRRHCLRVSSIHFSIVVDPDPGSGAFLIPGSQTHIFESLLTICWYKVRYYSSLWNHWIGLIFFLYLLILNFIFAAIKKGGTTFFPLFFWCCYWMPDPGSEIRDPGSGMDKNQDPG